MKRSWLFILIVALLLTSCASRLPAQRPEDFFVNYSLSAGMLPYGSNVSVAGEVAHTSFFAYGVSFDVAFQPTAAELDSLYQVVVDNKFDRIQTYEEEIYDRGGSSLTVTANGETFNKADGGMSYIRGNWQNAYNNVEAAVKDLTIRNAPTSTKFVIEWDESLAALYPTIHIDMGGDFLKLSTPSLSSGDLIRHADLTTSNPAAAYEVTVETRLPDPNSVSYHLDLTQTQHVLIRLQDGQIVFEPQTP